MNIIHPLRSLRVLNIAQFISAFADNVIFFVILGLLANTGMSEPEREMAVVQIGFLLAYVVLAPFVGAFADRHRKSKVLVIGNCLKAVGILFMLLGASPVISYAVVGIGAVVYSPAKYGVLVEICRGQSQLLMKANGQLESSTIAAILLGTLGGGYLAAFSPMIGMTICFVLYLISLVLSPFVQCDPGNEEIRYRVSARAFFQEVKLLFRMKKTRFTLLGTSAFWMTSSVLRLAFLIWLAEQLFITDKFQQSMVVGVTGVGIVVGALLAPYLTTVGRFYKSYLYGFLMMLVILVSVFSFHIYITVIELFIIGVLGSIFLIPMNAVLQLEGKDRVGSGKTIAIQNFSENLFMVLGVGAFQLGLTLGVPVQLAIVGVAALLGGVLLYLRIMIPNLRGETQS